MFSIRRKSKKPEDTGAPVIRPTLSLPELSQNAPPLQWPEELVSISEVNEPTAAKAELPVDHGPIPFHKPFRSLNGNGQAPPPPSAFDTFKTRPPPRRATQRKTRVPPTFNLMVVGAQGCGKTSLLRLLLETADLSPTATVDQRAVMERFLRGDPKRTQSIQTACVEIYESKTDRILFSVVDTPGLDFRETRELKLERQVSGIMKYVDSLYADTMAEESKVARQSKGDQHIHLCIYMIDPSSIMSASARRALSSLPSKTHSESTLRYSAINASMSSDGHGDEDEDEESKRLTMSPAEIRVIRRLSERVNVLPVIARSDSLTDESLAELKDAIRRDLRGARIDLGIFEPAGHRDVSAQESIPSSPVSPAKKSAISFAIVTTPNGTSPVVANGDDASKAEDDKEADADDGRQSRPVIKLRRPRHAPSLRRSRSRGRLLATEELVEDPEDELDTESVANVRFSAAVVSKANLAESLPFALMVPERSSRRRRPSMGAPLPTASLAQSLSRSISLHSADTGSASGDATPTPLTVVTPSENGDAHPAGEEKEEPLSPSSEYTHSTHARSRPASYVMGPPEDLRGVFLRKFRWGTIDVLDPNHCDFAAMRTAVLSTHMKSLKNRTREVLYEKYRTEKLLARRATRTISEDETLRLLEDLGL